jgi:hypothetical protein
LGSLVTHRCSDALHGVPSEHQDFSQLKFRPRLTMRPSRSHNPIIVLKRMHPARCAPPPSTAARMPFGFHDAQAACRPKLMEPPGGYRRPADVTATINENGRNMPDHGEDAEYLLSIPEKSVMRPTTLGSSLKRRPGHGCGKGGARHAEERRQRARLFRHQCAHSVGRYRPAWLSLPELVDLSPGPIARGPCPAASMAPPSFMRTASSPTTRSGAPARPVKTLRRSRS